MDIASIRERLQDHRPNVVVDSDYARAAVALILRDGEEGAEFVTIHRSHRDSDPWSGHMALPGGRQDAGDHDLFATAARETHEEVGIDLHRHGELLGHLDDLRAIGRGRPLDLVISPFVCALTTPVHLVLNRHEVQNALWVPLAALQRREAQGRYRHTHDGQAMEHDAFVYQGYTIWGLTYRILREMLSLLPEP